MAKYYQGMYKNGSFCGGSNININLIICEGKIIIPLMLQIYVLKRYNTYLLHPGMDRREEIICQHFYWHGNKKYVFKEVSKCDTFLIYKNGQIKIW